MSWLFYFTFLGFGDNFYICININKKKQLTAWLQSNLN